jgi:hypothetical protein
MDDVLGWGADRLPRRRLLGVAAIVFLVLVAAVAVALHIPQHRHAAPHRGATAAAPGPVQLAGLGSAAARLLNQTGAVSSPASDQLRNLHAPTRNGPVIDPSVRITTPAGIRLQSP